MRVEARFSLWSVLHPFYLRSQKLPCGQGLCPRPSWSESPELRTPTPGSGVLIPWGDWAGATTPLGPGSQAVHCSVALSAF